MWVLCAVVDVHNGAQIITDNFDIIVSVFKRYSAFGTIGDVFNMQWNSFAELAQDMKVGTSALLFYEATHLHTYSSMHSYALPHTCGPLHTPRTCTHTTAHSCTNTYT